MIASQVLSEKELKKKLTAKGFTETNQKTRKGTGTFWKDKNGKLINVPLSEQGFYPDWMIADLEAAVGKLRNRYPESDKPA